MNQKSNATGVRRNPRKAGKTQVFERGIALGADCASIKVFVGTHKTQGQRTSDFCWTHDGEPLYLGFECDSDQEPDDRCGCHRSFCGMNNHRATTTALVVECRDGFKAIADLYIESQKRAGWLKDATRGEILRWRLDFGRFIQSIQKFPLGAVVEKRGPYIQVRKEKP